MRRRMKPRASFQYRQKMSFRTGVLVIASVAAITGTIVFLLNFTQAPPAFAATCSSSYTVDWTNPATFTVNCGTVNPSSWTVKGDSCWYTSPTLTVGGVAGEPNRTVELSVRVNQSGNMTNNDFCWIYFYANGAVQSSYIARGDTVTSGVFYVPVTLTVPAGGTYRVSVTFKNDKTNEFWEVKKGDVIACVVAPPTPLPVELTSFSASMTSNGAQLKWTTASEVNNSHFIISRSEDATEYTPLGRIPGHGTTSVRNDYTFTDDHVPPGTSYYKLSQSDYDGTTKDYGPITLRNKNTRNIEASAFPNPFDADFNYSFGASEAGSGSLVIMDLRGALIEEIPVQFGKGVNTLPVNPTRLKPGLYLVGLRNGDNLDGVVKICRK